MKRLTRRTRPATVHVIASCQQCPWSTERYRTGRAQARQHVAKTGHTVHVEIGQTYSVRPAT